MTNDPFSRDLKVAYRRLNELAKEGRALPADYRLVLDDALQKRHVHVGHVLVHRGPASRAPEVAAHGRRDDDEVRRVEPLLSAETFADGAAVDPGVHQQVRHELLHRAFRERYGCDPVADIEAQVSACYDRRAVMWDEVGWL